jgi:hypothetical protein
MPAAQLFILELTTFEVQNVAGRIRKRISAPNALLDFSKSGDASFRVPDRFKGTLASRAPRFIPFSESLFRDQDIEITGVMHASGFTVVCSTIETTGESISLSGKDILSK